MAAEILVPAGITVLHHFGRPVWLDAFYIDRSPVTNGEYRNFLEQTGRPFLPMYWARKGLLRKEFIPKEGELSDPVTCVSWHDARAYAKWVGKRLPKWVEFVRAARDCDERGWLGGTKDDIASWYRWRLSKHIPIPDAPHSEYWAERMEGFLDEFLVNEGASSQLSFFNFEWAEEDWKETIEIMEESLRVPQRLRTSMDYELFFQQNFHDTRSGAYYMYQYIPGFRLPACSSNEKPIFAPGAFLGKDTTSRYIEASMHSSLPAGIRGDRVGFRCARDA